MKKGLALFFLSVIVVVIAADHDQREEVEHSLEEINNLEASRIIRDADAGKRKKVQRKARKLQRKARKGQRKTRKRQSKAGKQSRKVNKKIKRVGKKQIKSNKRPRKEGKRQRKARKRQLKAGKKQKKTEKRRMGGGKRMRHGGGEHEIGGGRCYTDVNATCVETAVKLLKMFSTKITNYLKQQKRIAKFNKTRESKSGKKGLFGPIASKVIEVGGGNSSDLSCSGNKTSEGATKLKEIIANLSKCEEDIKNACDVSGYPLPNKTEADACVSNMESMKKSVDACTKKTGDEACTCWMDSSLKATAEAVKKCDIASENKRVTSEHKQCTAAFSACKKIEDSSVDYIYACSQSANDLKVKAAQTKKNVDALEAAKNKTSTLAGSSSGRSTVIRKRATSVSTCSDFVTLSAKLLTAADEAPTSSAVETMAKILSAVSDTLSCSTAEKSTLTVQVTTYTQTISKVTATYNGLKASVEDASGTTSDAEIVAAGEAATTSTKKVVAKRNRLVRDILSNLN